MIKYNNHGFGLLGCQEISGEKQIAHTTNIGTRNTIEIWKRAFNWENQNAN